MTSTYNDIATLHGREVYDRDGDKVGTVGQIYADHAGQPAWASVNTGLFGLRQTLVPLNGTTTHGDGLRLPFDKATVKAAPNVDHEVDEPLTNEQVQELYRHYQLEWDAGTTGYTEGGGETGYASGSETGYAAGDRQGVQQGVQQGGNDAMTRSEERLNVDTERQQTGTARLRKYVVTENVQTTVPVQREEVRLEREPVTESNYSSATSGPDITESEHEVTLHAERPVVQKETVPVEQVRLSKDTVTDQERVGGEVRKERIDADLPDEDGRRQIG